MSRFIEWETLENPIYEHEGWSVKDACMAYHDGFFYLFFSAFYLDDGRERSHVVSVKTRDFKEFSEPIIDWRRKSGVGSVYARLTSRESMANGS